MNATREAKTPKAVWIKHGFWRQSSNNAPLYTLHGANVTVYGEWTNTGNNQQGRRKERGYALYVDGKWVDCGSLARLQALGASIAAKGGAR